MIVGHSPGGLKFTHPYLDDWGEDELPHWKLILEHYATDLSQRNTAAIGQLLDPTDRRSFSRLGSLVADFSCVAKPGIKVIMSDDQYPDYSRYCLKYPGGASQEVFITRGNPGGSSKKWVLWFFDDRGHESC